MLTVYQFEFSPFCIAVTAALRSLDTPFQTIEAAYDTRREIIELTQGAYYQAPLILDDARGHTLVYESHSESQDIALYIDHHYGRGQLFPPEKEGLQSLLIAHLEHEVENITFRLTDPSLIASIPDLHSRTLIIRHKERKFGRGCFEEWRQQRPHLLATAERLLTPYEKILHHTPFLLGDRPVYADFLLYGILGNLTYRDINAHPGTLPALKRWYDRMTSYRY